MLSSLVVQAFLEAMPEELTPGESVMLDQPPLVRVTAVTGFALELSFSVPGSSQELAFS
jgi:hypothetical protein